MIFSKKISVIELREENSLGSGRHVISNSPLLSTRSQRPLTSSGSAAIPCRPVRSKPLFPPQALSPRMISTRFSEMFGLTILENIGPTYYKEVVGFPSEWYILSARLSGDTLESVRRSHYRLGAHSCYLVRYHRDMSHSLQSVSQTPLTEACIAFRPSVLTERIGCTSAELGELFSLGGKHDPELTSLAMTPDMEAIVQKLRSSNPMDSMFSLFAEAQALELISLYLRELRVPAKRQAVEGIGQIRPLRCIRRHLEVNFNRTCSISELSRLVGLSPKRLATLFRREFGTSIHQYHQKIRMEIASAWLRRGAFGVSRVADLLGYEHPGNFTRAFYNYSGMSPTAYAAVYAPRATAPSRGSAMRGSAA